MGRRSGAAVLGAALVLTLVALPSAGAGERPDSTDPLAGVIDRLDVLAAAFGSTGLTAVTVRRLDTVSFGSLRGAEMFKAASAVKVVWTAAALDRAGVDGVAHLAAATLYGSSNNSAGFVLDAAGGIDRVNGWSIDRGLVDTIVYDWNFDRPRRSRLYPGPLRGLNTATTNDLARFWEGVVRGYFLGRAEREALLEWTRGAKSSAEADRLAARLPGEVAAASSWKMGWLPVGREYELKDGETGSGGEEGGEVIVLTGGAVSLGSGVVRLPDGRSYVIAIGAYNGTSWGSMVSWVEYGSCVVYSAISGDRTSCIRSRDPAGIRNRVTAPVGSLEMAVGRPGTVTVWGWAADPDAWWDPTVVTVTVDGETVGTAVATPTGLADLARPRFSRVFVHDADPGSREVCAVARNDGRGADTPIGCITIVVG